MGGNTGKPVRREAPVAGAAMEPPGNGRKHVLVDFGDTFDLIAPQWSRPVMGGNTRTRQSANQLIR